MVHDVQHSCGFFFFLRVRSTYWATPSLILYMDRRPRLFADFTHKLERERRRPRPSLSSLTKRSPKHAMTTLASSRLIFKLSPDIEAHTPTQ